MRAAIDLQPNVAQNHALLAETLRIQEKGHEARHHEKERVEHHHLRVTSHHSAGAQSGIARTGVATGALRGCVRTLELSTIPLHTMGFGPPGISPGIGWPCRPLPFQPGGACGAAGSVPVDISLMRNRHDTWHLSSVSSERPVPHCLWRGWRRRSCARSPAPHCVCCTRTRRCASSSASSAAALDH